MLIFHVESNHYDAHGRYLSSLFDNTTFDHKETLRLVLFLEIEIVMWLLWRALLRFGLLPSSSSLEEDSGE